mmetsp:Transcript_12411/g.20568  ORF Transcript_12411/g.20568 Transcript_12411/m.20568 type:complete len:331 (+) Transcript_12411:87-1079(+)|eukprot:CAMPEP_0119008802 /NCGR_PEP_ID=MMETSP1176-20130426/3948_1 /TAXON_ID=265551 /ORGANISM="Synedropsis recta cf, Strain CCMP1620" /LENGTH=330 /DNA_ID=CAMNT_0006961203 /DNA_START=70 /DNA_END=1062 /DNA_ORIENTATION=+
MKLVLAKTLWGVEGLEDDNQWDSIFARIQQDGYTMIECVAAFSFGRTSPARAQKFHDAAAKYNLQIICQIHTSGGFFSKDTNEYVYCQSFELEDHLVSVATELDVALHAHPVLINCHGGVDAWDHETQVQFLLGAMAIAKKRNVNIQFETHRQRLFGNPFQTRSLLTDERLQNNKELKLTADLSHWVVACERQLQHSCSSAQQRDPWWPDLLQLVAAHTTLIHCRVGYPEGPQVPDVTDPAYILDVQAHLEMWSVVWNVQREKNGMTESICEVEHGPAPYMWTLPHTAGQPVVADLWKVNNDVAALVRAKYKTVEDELVSNTRAAASLSK